MKIKVRVDRAECFRQRIDYDADILELDIGPQELNNEERDWIASHLTAGSEFAPESNFSGICPPTKERFLEVVRKYMSGAPYGGSDEGLEAS
jgi:hypothetical protein